MRCMSNFSISATSVRERCTVSAKDGAAAHSKLSEEMSHRPRLQGPTQTLSLRRHLRQELRQGMWVDPSLKSPCHLNASDLSRTCTCTACCFSEAVQDRTRHDPQRQVRNHSIQQVRRSGRVQLRRGLRAGRPARPSVSGRWILERSSAYMRDTRYKNLAFLILKMRSLARCTCTVVHVDVQEYRKIA